MIMLLQRRFFASLKKEELYRINFKSEREFYQCVDAYMVFYNTERPHETLNYKTPEKFEALYHDRKSRSAKIDKGFGSRLF